MSGHLHGHQPKGLCRSVGRVRAVDLRCKQCVSPSSFLPTRGCLTSTSDRSTDQVDTLVLCNNWLSAPPSDPSCDGLASPDESPDDQEHPEGPSLDTLNYWAHRLMPLHDPPPLLPEMREGEEGGARIGRETVVVVCNRVGTEGGSSALVVAPRCFSLSLLPAHCSLARLL